MRPKVFGSLRRIATAIAAAAGLLVSTPVASAATVSLPPEQLAREIATRTERVEEFRFIREVCQELKLRCWLFGGTAAGYGHYVKWDLLREGGDSRFQPDRFDYDYTNIFRSTQDADIVVNGTAAQAEELERRLVSRYSHLQGSKPVWEVRLLEGVRGDKEALLGNADFLNQHTDSNSTGMIEVTRPPQGESAIRDLRDWTPQEGRMPEFFQDIHESKLHFYHSGLHGRTSRAKKGLNPPILAAIRYLTKAFQYELKLQPEDWQKIRQIIEEFNPGRDLQHSYVPNWIEKNGRKLIQNAVNIEYARAKLDELGLRRKLLALGNTEQIDSLAWWLNRDPLPSRRVGEGRGKTAREIFQENGWLSPRGELIVAHETDGFLAYESITRAHTGEPNVLVSRQAAAGETAVHGDGFYTRAGREGARGTGFTIRFKVNPGAREGKDFSLVDDYLIFHNKSAFEVIPEIRKMSLVEYYKLLLEQDGFDHSDLGILTRLRRRISTKAEPEAVMAVGELILDRISEQADSKAAASLATALSDYFRHYGHLPEMHKFYRRLFGPGAQRVPVLEDGQLLTRALFSRGSEDAGLIGFLSDRIREARTPQELLQWLDPARIPIREARETPSSQALMKPILEKVVEFERKGASWGELLTLRNRFLKLQHRLSFVEGNYRRAKSLRELLDLVWPGDHRDVHVRTLMEAERKRGEFPAIKEYRAQLTRWLPAALDEISQLPGTAAEAAALAELTEGIPQLRKLTAGRISRAEELVEIASKYPDTARTMLHPSLRDGIALAPAEMSRVGEVVLRLLRSPRDPAEAALGREAAWRIVSWWPAHEHSPELLREIAREHLAWRAVPGKMEASGPSMLLRIWQSPRTDHILTNQDWAALLEGQRRTARDYRDILLPFDALRDATNLREGGFSDALLANLDRLMELKAPVSELARVAERWLAPHDWLEFMERVIPHVATRAEFERLLSSSVPRGTQGPVSAAHKKGIADWIVRNGKRLLALDGSADFASVLVRLADGDLRVVSLVLPRARDADSFLKLMEYSERPDFRGRVRIASALETAKARWSSFADAGRLHEIESRHSVGGLARELRAELTSRPAELQKSAYQGAHYHEFFGTFGLRPETREVFRTIIGPDSASHRNVAITVWDEGRDGRRSWRYGAYLLDSLSEDVLRNFLGRELAEAGSAKEFLGFADKELLMPPGSGRTGTVRQIIVEHLEDFVRLKPSATELARLRQDWALPAERVEAAVRAVNAGPEAARLLENSEKPRGCLSRWLDRWR